ncbi:MAG: chorismate-binding protein [Bacteroidota bacterium]|nr:chorismate-binding protein [Bacteroidota bacterium]
MTKEDFFQKIQQQLKAQKAFVCYRKPGQALSNLLLQQDYTAHELTDFSENGFVFAPFDRNGKTYFIPQNTSEIIQFELPEVLITDEETSSDYEGSYVRAEEDQKDHELLVQKGIDAIRDQRFRKVVLSRSELVELNDPSPMPIFKKLLQKYREAFVYCWFHPKTGLWMGATPETLLQVERDRFETMALAGTQVNKGQEQIEWGQKELEEQLLVTDFILNALEGLPEIKIGEISKPYSAHAGTLLHIRTDISGKVSQAEDQSKLIEALHPTPAVCGLPRKEALEFIQKHEHYDREYYSGFLGELNFKTNKKRNGNRRNQENQQFSAIVKQTSLYVNLRCMKLKDGDARIYIGGGITRDSDPAHEWMETVNKAQTMKSVLVK